MLQAHENPVNLGCLDPKLESPSHPNPETVSGCLSVSGSRREVS